MRSYATLLLFLAAASCAQPETPAGRANEPLPHVVFLTREGCAQSPEMRENLAAAYRLRGLEPAFETIDAASLPAADPRTGYGTPAILNDGRNIGTSIDGDIGVVYNALSSPTSFWEKEPTMNWP